MLIRYVFLSVWLWFGVFGCTNTSVHPPPDSSSPLTSSGTENPLSTSPTDSTKKDPASASTEPLLRDHHKLAKNYVLHEKTLFEQASQQNTIQAYDQYLRTYPNGKYVTDVEGKRESLWIEKAAQQHTIESYEQYIQEYPKGIYLTEALQLIESLYFKKAKESNTVEAYDAYLEKYPTGEFTTKAQQRREEKVFANIKKNNTLQGYRDYLQAYPRGQYQKEVDHLWFEWLNQNQIPLWDQAEETVSCQNAYEIKAAQLNIRSQASASSKWLGRYRQGARICALKQQEKWVETDRGWVSRKYLTPIPSYEETLDVYELYLLHAPLKQHSQEVRKLRKTSLFRWTTLRNTTASHDRFLQKYPTGRHAKRVIQLREDSRFEEAVANNTPESYAQYQKEYPKGRYQREVRQLKEHVLFEQAARKNTITAYDNYLQEYPQGKHARSIKKLRKRLIKQQKHQKRN